MYDKYGHWHDVYWHHEYWHPMGILFSIVLLSLVIFGVGHLIQWYSKSPKEGSKNQDSALDTLRKRYAAGEISAEEYMRKKKDLES
jgi:uncharacterized membrane protein